MQEFYPKGYVGVDKAGRPIFVDRCGMLKLAVLWQVITEERYYLSIY